MFEALAGYVNILLTFFYNLVGDYGVAIIILTALVNVVTFPLSRKQIEASKKMQEIQPELKRLQEKYKNDKEKYNIATMEFMKDKKVNPLGGCLPLLIQFPILIAVFTLLKNPDMIRSAVTNFNPYFLFFGLDLTKPDPFYILPILASGATFVQQKMVMTDPKQKMFLYVFPVMIMFISIKFPAGLVLYWFTNSLFSIGNHFMVKSKETGKKGEPGAENKKIHKKDAKEIGGKEPAKKIQSNQKISKVIADKSSKKAPEVKKKITKKKKKKKKKGARKTK